MAADPQDPARTTARTPARVSIRDQKIIDADGATVGRWIEARLVDRDGAGLERVEHAVRAASAGDSLACWAGSPTADEGDPFPDDPAAWTPSAWAALESALDRLGPALDARGVTLLLRPHHRHVVGDVPSVMKIRRTAHERGWTRVGVLLDVEAMLSPSMRERHEADHRRRLREALAPVAALEVV